MLKLKSSELLYEDPKFSQRELAALVASKVYYHLGDYDDSVDFALRAGKLFDTSSKDEYIQTIITKCIDRYVEVNSEPDSIAVMANGDDAEAHGAKAKKTITPGLEQVVDRMYQRCLEDKEYKQALGIALESRKLDTVEMILEKANDNSLKTYILTVSLDLIQNAMFRNKVLRLLATLFLKQSPPDYYSASRCAVHLNDSEMASAIIRDLVSAGGDSVSAALQICFDLDSTATQEFLHKVSSSLEPKEQENGEGQTNGDNISLAKVRSILAGDESGKLYVEFLYRNNKTDKLILTRLKESLEARVSIFHSGLTFANAFMNAGTLSDNFIRTNLDWLAKASNWSKFTATAALGVIHKGHISQGMALLSPYLPGASANGSPYSEGGSLFALGLIHANHGAGALDYLRTQLKSTQDEIIQHGAALGLGVAGMATASESLYEDLKEVLFSDSAIVGEASGISMGLLMLGTGSERAIEEMLQYAHETQHEKIVRGLLMGVALLSYGLEEKADPLINQLLAETEHPFRYGGVYAIALAYCGTGNNKAIKMLLHVAVSDVSDDVRRAATLSLGFILFRNPTAVPPMVKLLSESYNPHLRYGAAMALGIACAGTGLSEAVDILEPMTKDVQDYVRQGAMLALAMVLIQQNEFTSSKVGGVRQLLRKVVSETLEDALAKFGATVAQGILDAGGRNVTIALQTSSGSLNLQGIVGMALFTQFWFWFPLANFLPLAFTPTAIIAVTDTLKVPKFKLISNAKSSLYSYPPPVAPIEVTKVEMVATAVLSTTAKAAARAKKSEKEKAEREGQQGMDEDKNPTPAAPSEPAEPEAMQVDAADEVNAAEPPAESQNHESGNQPEILKQPVAEGEKDSDGKERRRKVKRDDVSKIKNMTRVLPAQLPVMSFPKDCRYHAVQKVSWR